MILVLGGTADGRQIVRELKKAGYRVIVTVISSYGGALAAEVEPDQIVVEALGKQGLAEILVNKGIKAVVDATHPYARVVSLMARETCQEMNIAYIRYERPITTLPQHPLLVQVVSYAEAAEKAAQLGEVIFLTSGSKTLSVFADVAKNLGKKLIARVLPDPQVITKCLDLGLTPNQVIAMQGPFSKELNMAMFQQTGAQVIITKESGRVGGVDTKIEAALELNLPVVIIGRPEEANENCKSVTEVLDAVNLVNERGVQQ